MTGFLLVVGLFATAVLAAVIFGWLDRRHARTSVRRYRAARAARAAEARLRHAVHTREQHPGTNQQLLADCQAIWNQPERRQQ